MRDKTDAMTVIQRFASSQPYTAKNTEFAMKSPSRKATSATVFPTRRILLLGGLVHLMPSVTLAQDLCYRGWRFGIGFGVAPLSDELIHSLQAQIDIVESLDIRPEIKTFFRSVPLEIDKTTTGGAGAYSFREHRMFLSTHVDSPENPVFLHELLHAYHDLKLPDGVRNRRVTDAYAEAERNRTFRADAYMMKNEKEFFAMCASVVLWGRAARPPSTRETVREKLPVFYDWIVAEFGFKPKPNEEVG